MADLRSFTPREDHMPSSERWSRWWRWVWADPLELVEGAAIIGIAVALLAAGLVVILLFVEFVLGIDFIAWIVGDPIGDIGRWVTNLIINAIEAVEAKLDRIKDSYEGR